MNDFQMNQLASDRRHQFQREAELSRLTTDRPSLATRLASRSNGRVAGLRRPLRSVFAR